MGRTMTLEVPESIYEPLAKTAEQRGRMPEQLALEWLVTALRTAANDPVENFIGAFVSDIPDWTDRHDEYLGQVQTTDHHFEQAGFVQVLRVR